MQRIPLPFKCFLGWYDPSGLPCQLLWKLFLQHQPQPLQFNFADKVVGIYCFLQRQPLPLQFNFTGKAGKFYCFLQCQPHLLLFNFADKAVGFYCSCSVNHNLYCSILQIKQGNSTVSCSVNPTFYNRLSPKMAFLISFSWSKTKRATMALSSAVEGSLMLDADFKRSRTLFRSESIYTVASLESRAL